MVKIVVREDSLEVRGHAMFDEHGRDIVCAAISSLTLGSANIWRDRSDVVCSFPESGVGSFRFLWNDSNQDLRIQVNFLKEHYKLIAKNYPKFVSYCEILSK